MIAVDSSVWIAHLNDQEDEQVRTLRLLVGRVPLLVGDVVLCEVLQGLSNEREAERVERALRRFEVRPMLSPALAVKAAANFRALRRLGITVRKTIDMIIGTFCIENGHTLLHRDADFDPLRDHLGLRVL